MRFFPLALAQGSAITALLFTAQQSGANELAGIGYGAEPCARFEELYRLDPTHTEINFIIWAQGFLSGMNMAALLGGGVSKNLAMPAGNFSKAIQQYCDMNPSGQVLGGILILYKTLPENTPPIKK